ncbi:hypothetical protein M409DRAFT_28671 [Zasmidium cellare ATCC 36951]|uniref:palmitoyl-protein hydrolase n=1 Tax=Zasmidium cellare ATCC 36951 TaxID=1080233 RepID=A0A6A6C3C3_ZASCE|nr:uncharacterized protein M409DRAFT_28671 [Zasmidium cellare ATCC 36951]KAF2160788.1 hypothetical protein M409DRAFT_28671 [Zasmidium cellare ATCC 36951]
MYLLALPTTLTLLALTTATALPSPSTAKTPLPLLIWHGLGDRHDAEGLHSVGDLAKEIYPGTHVHYIRLDENGDNDRKETFFGNVSEQIGRVCEGIQNDEELWKASLAAAGGGKKGDELIVDAIGFSQGGQFLRGLLQRCEGLSFRTLITFGSQHNGIAAIKACGTWDLLCKGALALMKNNAWTEYVQSHVVPAQYYRTVNVSTGEASGEYLAHSSFLADVNNERDVKNQTYKERLVEGLKGKYVMYVFEEDTTVIPKETGWFDEVLFNKTKDGDDDEERIVVPLRERRMYKEDWLGLKVLDERGALVFRSHPGDHMQLDEEVLKGAFEEFLGPLDKGEEVEVEEDGDLDGDVDELVEGQNGEKVIFDCTRYRPSYLEGWCWEITHAWENWGGPWRSERVWKQGL